MLFNSFSFLVFFSLVVVLFFSIPFRFRNIFLLLASYFFYMLWKPEYAILLAFSTISSYYTAILIFRKTDAEKRKYLVACISLNLLILFFFKYFNFFNSNVRTLFTLLHIDYKIPDILAVILPVGISFYTFETISYVLDIYYERREPENKLSTYALYISFFPKLLAGPIEKSTGLLVQLNQETSFKQDRIIEGLRRMLWGFFKKVVIADRLSVLIDPVYAHPSNYSGGYILFCCYLFAFQIYCDFSGYTDIAIGASKILGYDIVENFNQPYISKNVGEFWRRWHLSLSNWLRDYLFTPIIFKRKDWGNSALVYATFITFVLCGLWHGARWTFVIFGLLQGIVISFELVSKKWRKGLSEKLPRWIYDNGSWIITFHFVVFSFVFFRADNTTIAFEIINRIGHIGFNSNYLLEFSKFGIFSLIILLSSIFFLLFVERKFTPTLSKFNQLIRGNYLFSFITLTLVIVLGYFHPQIFIYFNF